MIHLLASRLILIKLTIATSVSIVALAIPFYFCPPEISVQTVKFYGYWLMMSTLGLFLWTAWCVFSKTSSSQLRQLIYQHSLGILLAAIIAAFLQTQDNTEFKILYDEHVLSSTAMNMHSQQIAYVQAAGHVIEETTIASIGHVDKRPLLFPFILSTVHNVFGFDYSHVFALNAALTFVSLALLYSLLAKLTDRTYGWLGLLLFGGLPLLAQNATGGGYEILNLCFITGLALSTIYYLDKDVNPAGQNLMIMTAIMLANVRYESILYVLVPAAAFLLKSMRTGNMQLTWFSVLSPLLLILPMMSYALFSNEPSFIQTSQTNFFSLSHLPDNVAHALAYVFDWRGDYTNSVLLSVFGLIGIILFIFYFIPRFLKLTQENSRESALLLVLFVVLANTILALSHYWGAWTDPATSRFSMPLQLLMVICPALVLYKLFRHTSAPLWLISLAGIHLLFVTPRHCERMSQEPRLSIAKGYNWAMQWISQNAPDGNHLYIAQSASGIGLLGVGAIPLRIANARPESVFNLKEIGMYQEIFVFEILRHVQGEAPQPLKGGGISRDEFDLETFDQIYVNDTMLCRISRITARKPVQHEKDTADKEFPEILTIDQILRPDHYRLVPLTP